MVDLGKTHRLQERAKSVPAGFVTRAKLSDTPYMEPLNSALDCTFPKDSEFDLILPIMRNATSLDWTMPSIKDGFDPTTANTARFLSSPSNNTQLSYSSHLLHPDVQGHFISFFHKLRKCIFSLWDPLNSVHVFSGHVSCFSISRHSKRYGSKNASQVQCIGFWIAYSIALLLLCVFESSVGTLEILLSRPTNSLASYAWLRGH